jgi:Na+/H+-dicarboxylate symporter
MLLKKRLGRILSAMSRLLKLPFALQILLALILGCVTGLIFGPGAEPLGEFGGLIIRLLKILATPLVFFAVAEGAARVHFHARQGLKLLFICAVNGSVAAAVAIGLSSVLRIHERVDLTVLTQLAAGEKLPDAKTLQGLELSVLGVLKSVVPQSIVEPFAANAVLTIVLFALLAGLSVRAISRRGSESGPLLERALTAGLQLITEILGYVVRLVPIAVFGVIAKVVGTTGFSVFGALGLFVLLITLGMAIQVFLYYSLILKALARTSPWEFFRKGKDAILTGLFTGSSLASLPVTLRTLEGPMKVSTESSRLAACIGTNFNNDGILLYEVATALFIAQVYGIDLSWAQKIALAGVSAVAAAGIAGIPEAGLITLSLVLTAVGLPLGLLPVLVSVDWLIGRLRAATNVTADMTVATLLDRFKPFR